MLILLKKAFPYIAAVLLVAAILFSAYRFGVHVTTAEWTAKWETQAKELAEAKADAERIQREEEQRRQTAIDEVRNHAQNQIKQMAADATAANAAADSLREQAKRLAEQASKACSNASPAIGGQAVSAPGMVLADVLARLDERTGELAAAYDGARAAGTACERSYDAVRGGR